MPDEDGASPQRESRRQNSTEVFYEIHVTDAALRRMVFFV